MFLNKVQALFNLVGKVNSNKHVDAVGNKMVELNFNFGLWGKPAGGSVYTTEKKEFPQGQHNHHLNLSKHNVKHILLAS